MMTLTALRPGQWVKNLLVFVPLVFGKKLFSSDALLRAAAAFLVFCAAAGAAYLVNDLMDIREDRRHPVKRLRPVASGKIDASEALWAAGLLAAFAATAAFLIDIWLGGVILAYLALNIAYAKAFKKIALVDVSFLGVFFLLRLMGGSVAAGVVMSRWVIFLTAMLALFLGFNKRRRELDLLGWEAGSCRSALGVYAGLSLERLTHAISFLIMVAYVWYTLDHGTAAFFGSRHMVYSAPFVFFGMLRYSYLIRAGRGDGDPAGMLLIDLPTQLNVAAWGAVCVLVIYFGL